MEARWINRCGYEATDAVKVANIVRVGDEYVAVAEVTREGVVLVKTDRFSSQWPVAPMAAGEGRRRRRAERIARRERH